VLIVVPNCQGRVSPVFDVAARLFVVRLENGVELGRREVVLFEKQPDGIVRSLIELGVEVLICAGISQELQGALEKAGIRVLAQVCGEIELVLAAYKTNRLKNPEFVMPGCCGRGCDGRGRRPQRRRARRSHHLRY